MNLTRLTPASLDPSRRYIGGRCSACDKPFNGEHSIVHLYGETFHCDCALRQNGNERRPVTRLTSSKPLSGMQ